MSREELLPRRAMRALVIAASAIVVVAGLREASEILLPFLSALFIAVVSLPVMAWLQRNRVPTWLAVMLTVLAAAGVVSVLGVVVGQSVGEFAQVVADSQYNQRFEELAGQLGAWAEEANLPFADRGPFELVDPEAVVNLLGGTLGALAGLLQDAFLVLLAVIFILVEAAGFRHKLRVAFGDRGGNLERLEQMAQQVQKYLAVKTVVSLGTGFLAFAWVWTLGIDFPLMWGLVAFLFNYIPNIGSIVAAVGPSVLALVQVDLGRALVVASGYVALNIAFGNILEPTLLGRKLGMSVLVVFLSLVFWGWVWGPMGLLLAVPITMTFKIAFENTDDLRWIAVLLDAKPRARPAVGTPPPDSPAAVRTPASGSPASPAAPSDAQPGPQAPTRSPAMVTTPAPASPAAPTDAPRGPQAPTRSPAVVTTPAPASPASSAEPTDAPRGPQAPTRTPAA